MGTKIRVSNEFMHQGRTPGRLRDDKTAYLRAARRNMTAEKVEKADRIPPQAKDMLLFVGLFALAFSLMGFFFG
ncbi:hypothetical protein [Parvularcula sp. IMCC14364]|uniref:hypothetical protein n=1 Tax=Parvularcula sp. IMCC14364 TaxID=3067902 RepID=UPI002741838B|nr:hypothetical protein [Parvularcula sp. IMCC14364]